MQVQIPNDFRSIVTQRFHVVIDVLGDDAAPADVVACILDTMPSQYDATTDAALTARVAAVVYGR